MTTGFLLRCDSTSTETPSASHCASAIRGQLHNLVPSCFNILTWIKKKVRKHLTPLHHGVVYNAACTSWRMPNNLYMTYKFHGRTFRPWNISSVFSAMVPGSIICSRSRSTYYPISRTILELRLIKLFGLTGYGTCQIQSACTYCPFMYCWRSTFRFNKPTFCVYLLLFTGGWRTSSGLSFLPSVYPVALRTCPFIPYMNN